ncbi:MAG: prephenate dehydrogenase/arogenate dehydrogenase family protein [Dehalococcoidia bacterium]
MTRIAIIGLGLIGGSLALALKEAKREGLEIAGCDADRDVTGRARKQGAIDVDADDAASAVEGAAVVVIATPILSVPKVMEEMAGALASDAVVTDTASTKRQVLRWAAELLPAGVSFVGGHPIAGKEQSGLDAADAALFQDRPWAITPSISASERAIKTVENIAALTGARPQQIDAEEHDSYMAAVSHLPLVATTALFSLASSSQAWPELASLAGPGFRDTTRLASTDPDLSHDICLTNRENVLHWIDRYLEELRRLRALIADGDQQDELFKAFAKAQAERDAFLEAPPQRPKGDGPKVPSAGEQMMTFMMGEYLTRRQKDVNEMIERMGRENEPRRRRT